MKTVNEQVVIVTVSEAQVLLSAWNKRRNELKGKTVVVENVKQHKVIAALQFIDIPDLSSLETECPECHGKGKVGLL